MGNKKAPNITKECVEEILDKKFLRVFDLKHTEGKHYFDATRRSFDRLVAPMSEEEFKATIYGEYAKKAQTDISGDYFKPVVCRNVAAFL